MELHEFVNVFSDDTDFIIYNMLGDILGRGSRFSDDIVFYYDEEINTVRCNCELEDTLDIFLDIYEKVEIRRS